VARVLILSLVWAPDAVSTASLMADVAQGLGSRGHAVTVLTSMPHYNLLPDVFGDPTLRGGRSRLYTDSLESGIRVLRVRMPVRGQRVWLRLIDYLWFHVATAAIAVLRVRRWQDVVFVASPPITLGIAGYLLAKMFGARLIYNVLELWPDVPIHMGLIRNQFLVRAVYAIESFVYRRATAIPCIGRSFVDRLARRGVPSHKLRFIPTFVDVEKFRLGHKDNAFARQFDLHDKFVLLYAGNIGLTQGLEVLIEAAVEFQHDEHVRILVVGDGAARPDFERAVYKAGVKNMLLLPFQERERVADVYATADVCVSPMRFGFSYYTIPSKVLTAMAAERVVVAAAEADTETARLLTESNGGVVVGPESAEALVAAIRQLRRRPDRRRDMGRRARQWVVDFYGREAILASYDRLVREIAGGPVK
jgi:putative colanic acid biosynthesis glycosyltransferase WcaI